MSFQYYNSILDQFRLDGRVALVTGASRGLGRSMALALAESGADIFVVGLNELDDIATEIRNRGVRCFTRVVDLSTLTEKSAEELISWCQDELQQPDILVNNAGMISRQAVLDTAEPEWNSVISLNLSAPFLLSQAFARGVVASEIDSASIINIGSINSFQGGMEVSSYAASKHGLLGLTRALANEWAIRGIRVNAITPGYIETDFTRAHREDPERAEAMLRRIPAGRWGRPEDLAGAVVYLASNASAYVTGSALTIDGGWLSR